MAVESIRFGEGTFNLGATPGTDFSCQVQAMGIDPDVDEGDNITVLCGDVVAGAVTFTDTLAGTFLQDFSKAGGIVEYSRVHKGETMDFAFVPSTDAATGCTGKVQVRPLGFGTSDGEFGDVLVSDFEWPVIGDLTFDWPVTTVLAASTGNAGTGVDEG